MRNVGRNIISYLIKFNLNKKHYLKLLYSIFLFFIFFIISSSTVSAVTRYVNSESNGAASNPTRPFNDPSYTANDSYQTLTAAYNAASSGDTIEFSGGINGITYATRNNVIAKANLTLKGSKIAGFNGLVTIDYNPIGGNYTIAPYSDGITFENMHITRTGGTGHTVALYSTNSSFKDVIISNNNGNSAIYGTTGANNNTFQNCIVNNFGLSGVQNTLYTNSGTITFNNCLITGMIYQAFDIYGGVTLNMNNSAIVAAGQNAGCNFRFFNSGAIVNTNHSLIHGGAANPNSFTCGTGTGTWNSTDDILDSFPYFISTKANFGYLTLTVDDQNNIAYAKSVADYTKSNFNIPITYYVDATYSISSSNKADLQYLYKQGHEIGTHTRHHSDLSHTNALNVTYSGSFSDVALVVSGSGTTLNITGSGDTHGPIDLTNSSYDTLVEVCTLISSWSNFSCSKYNTNINNLVISKSLKDASTSLPIGVTQAIPFDDDTGPNNRLYKDEITNSINELESALHEDPECIDYVVKTLALPFAVGNTTVLNWIRNNTNLIAVRSSTNVGTLKEKSWLGEINLFNLSNYALVKGTGYSGLSDSEKEVQVRRAAQVLATSLSQGYFFNYLRHTTSEFTLTEYGWFLDEFTKFTSYSNITIDTMANNANRIRTSGLWTNIGNGIWSRSFNGSDNFRVGSESPLINEGITISGRTDDLVGNPIVGNPDIGPYEFQLPTIPSSLAQYESDGTTSVSGGSYAEDTSVVLKFSMSSVNASDLLTPQIEIRPHGTSFTNSETNSGSAVIYSGSPVTGSVRITGLTSGNSYHWQARVSNVAGQSSWMSRGGNPDFIAGETPTPTLTPTPIVTPTVTASALVASPPVCNDTKPSTAPWLYGASVKNSDSILLQFTEVDEAVSEYVLEYGTESGKYQFAMANIGGKGTTSYEVTGLSPNTTYYFRVRASNGCATGDWSNEISAKTYTRYSLVTSEGDLETEITKTETNKKPQQTYTVKTGDSMYGIAIELFGDGGQYLKLIELNKDKYTSLATDPSAIQVGWELLLPTEKDLKETEDLEKEHGEVMGVDIKIKVVDEEKIPVIGAKVTLHSTPREGITNEEGVASFENVEPGEHKAVIAYEGYLGEQNVYIPADQEGKEIDFTVQVKATSPFKQPTVIAVIGGLFFLLVVAFGILMKRRTK